MATVIKRNMSNKEYHSLKHYVSSSDLKDIFKAPMIYSMNKAEEKEQTACMLLGSVCHKWLLEEDSFFDEYVLAPEINKNTTKYKEWKAEQLADAKHLNGENPKTIIDAEMLDKAKAMKIALKQSHILTQLVEGAEETELSVFVDATLGGDFKGFKCRPDLLHVKDRICIDYKTVADQLPDAATYRRRFVDLGYHMQAAHYTEVLKAAYDFANIRIVHLVQSKTAPYLAKAFNIPEYLINAGREDRSMAIGILRACCFNNNFNVGFDEAHIWEDLE